MDLAQKAKHKEMSSKFEMDVFSFLSLILSLLIMVLMEVQASIEGLPKVESTKESIEMGFKGWILLVLAQKAKRKEMSSKLEMDVFYDFKLNFKSFEQVFRMDWSKCYLEVDWNKLRGPN